MKLKYKFVVRNIDGQDIAVAVGRDNAKFRGMIKLNDTGSFIFQRLFEDAAVDGIAAELSRDYAISEEEALSAVKEFTDKLREGGLLEG